MPSLHEYYLVLLKRSSISEIRRHNTGEGVFGVGGGCFLFVCFCIVRDTTAFHIPALSVIFHTHLLRI